MVLIEIYCPILHYMVSENCPDSNVRLCVSFSTRPRVCIIADSDEESSSAGSSDEEELMPSEPPGPLADKSIHSGTEG